MSDKEEIFEFGDFTLNPSEKVLLLNGSPVSLTPKTADVLQMLVENHGHVVAKQDLMNTVWPEQFVEESNLTFTISRLRKALDPSRSGHPYIETVPKRGYRFVEKVEKKESSETDEVQPSLVQLLTWALRDRTILVISLLAGIIIAAGFWFGKKPITYYDRLGSAAIATEQLSGGGSLTEANISPDGRFMLYETAESGQETLWLRQISAGKDIPVFTTPETLHGTGFSADGESIYFAHSGPKGLLTLSQMPVLGGPPVDVVVGLHNGWTFSPDGGSIAFTRYDDAGTHLMIANSDGAAEREIFLSPKPRYLFGLAWAPDGRSIAYAAASNLLDPAGAGGDLYRLALDTSVEDRITDRTWATIGSIHWLPDQSGFLMSGRVRAGDAKQIWRLAYPGGQAEPLTAATADLELRGTTADVGRMIASRSVLRSDVWVASADDMSAGRPVGKAAFDVAWSRDGRLIYPTKNPVASDLWIAKTDGNDRKQLTVSDGVERSPETSSDGRYIAYVSSNSGLQNIWRMNSDGTGQVQLTDGKGEVYPVFTPDSNWVVYSSLEKGGLWKVPAGGGPSSQVCEGKRSHIAISPDGTRIAYFGRSRENKRMLLVETFPGCAPVRDFAADIVVASPPKVVWSNDGHSLIYQIDDAAGVGNLWRQALSTAPAEKLTNFRSDRIFDFAYSPDGKTLALVRGSWEDDAVLLRFDATR